MQTILALDDELSVRESYRMILGDKYRLLLVEKAQEGLKLLAERNVDLILLDLTMPGMSGEQFLRQMEERGETTPVIVVTGTNTVAAAVEVMKQGAHEFVLKPFNVQDLQDLVERTLLSVQRRREVATLRELSTAGFDNIIGSAPSLMTSLQRARQAMQVNSTVLITGETGTGKDVLARAIHSGGKRKDKPFVPLSCCAIPTELVESELFGHMRGAFTGATDTRVGKMQVANGGTLFLDEIGEMPMQAQAKLLRVLQDGSFYAVGGTKLIEVDVRFICATNRDFPKAIRDGHFREDLFYRINVLPITMPALRDRREDIPKLVAHFVAKHAPRVNAHVRDFAPRAMARLTAYPWPGNVRELENSIERILVCWSDQTTIQPEHLEGIIGPTRPHDEAPPESFEGLNLEAATQRLERQMILQALQQANYNQSQAAETLGTTRRILKYKMDQLGIALGPGMTP